MPYDLSIVIASFSGLESLERCLKSLYPWEPSTEVIVVSNLPTEQLNSLSGQFAGVPFLSSPKADVFALRTLGVQFAAGRAVALTEDHVTFAAGWLDAILEGLQHHPVVGGPIDNGLSGIWNWALFACEYMTFLPLSPSPGTPGEDREGGRRTPLIRQVPVLSGVNVAYRREWLDACANVWRNSFHENEVHDALRDLSHSFHRIESAAVAAHLKMTLAGAMRHLFTGARRYGRYRKARETGLRRLLLLPMTALVPAVLLKRILAAALSRRPQKLGTLLLGLPFILSLIMAWTCGEAAGYLSSNAPMEEIP